MHDWDIGIYPREFPEFPKCGLFPVLSNFLFLKSKGAFGIVALALVASVNFFTLLNLPFLCGWHLHKIALTQQISGCRNNNNNQQSIIFS
jgi:hypothetical protein